MPNSFEELLKGQEYLGTMGDMPGEASQKSMLMIFIADNSGSMYGERMDSLNQAFREMIPVLQKIQMDVNDAFQLSIAVLVFGTDAHWKVEPTPILQYVHTDLDSNGGGTNYGKALKALQSKLTRQEFMAHTGKIAEPYIMLMTDGQPNDNGYESVIEELNKNLWYSHAQRYAVLIGKTAIHDAKARAAVEAFVSDKSEGIVTAEEAKKIVEVVSAKTIHTIKNMTMRTPHLGEEQEVRKTAPSESSTPGDSENPYGDSWDFDNLDPSSIYGDDYVF